MTSELSQHDKDFAHAMALKLRLSRERKAADEKEQKLIVFLCQRTKYSLCKADIQNYAR